MTRNPRSRLTPTRVALCLIPTIALLAGCTAAQSSTDQDSSAVIAYKHELNTLDPVHADYAQTNLVDNAVYEPLVKYDPKGALVGQLASDFKVSPDATSVAFTLRSGVTFHDGSTLTAKDVKFTLDRAVRIGQGVASTLASYDSTQVVDDSHLVIHLKTPNGYFLGSLGNVYILDEALVTKNAGSDDGQGWLQAHDAGSGPYEANGESTTDGATVTRYDKYWAFDDKRPSQLVFRRIDESATQRDELNAGNIDIAIGVSAMDASSLKATNQVEFLNTAGQTQIFFNTSTGPTADPAVREALQRAFDYQGGFDKILNGHGAISSGTLADTVPCRPGSSPYGQDQAKAKQILQSAGRDNLSLSLRFQPADAVQTQLATLFQSDLKEIGVDVKLVPVAFADYLKLLSSPKTIPEMMLLNDYAGSPDPGPTLTKLYDSAAIGSTNKAAYHNAAVDKLLDQAQQAADATKRCDLNKQAQTLIAKDSPSVNMYQIAFPVAYRSGITGIVPSWQVTPFAPFDVRIS